MAATQGIRAGRAFVELFADDSRLVRGLRASERKIKAFGTSIRKMGTKLTAISAAALAPLAISTRTFAGFEQQMARVRALTGASDKNFKRLSDAAKRLGEQTVFSASQAAEAMSFFALAGFDVEQILGAIGPALDLAAAGQIEIAQAADISAKIMAGMGLTADELARSVDVLTKAMTTANTDLGQLGDAMKFVGPVAKSAGRGLEEIVAAIQLLSNAGIQGEMAGTTLRGALLALTSPSKEAAEELKRMGVRVLDARGNVRALADIIDDMNKAMQGLGGGQKLEIIGRIFDARQAAGFAELLAQGGDRLRQFTDALSESQGVAAKISGIQLDTLTGDVTILTSALEGLRIAIGEALGDVLRRMTQAMTRAVGMIVQWAKENRQVIETVAKVTAVVLAAAVSLILLGAIISGLGSMIGVLITAVTSVASVFKLLAGVIAFLVSPIGVVIAALGALGGYLIYITGAGGKALLWLGERFRGLQETATSAWRGIGDALAAGDIGLAAKILWLTLKMEFQKGINVLKAAWMGFKHFFIDTGNKAFFGLLAAGEIVWHGLQIAWIETIAFFKRLWHSFASSVASVWRSVVGWVERRIHDVHGVVDSGFDAEEAKKISEANEDADLKQIQSDKNSALAQVERDREAKRRQESALHEETLGLIGREYEDARGRLNDEAANQREQSEAALKQARQEWLEALEAAQAKRVEVEGAEGPEGVKGPEDIIAKTRKALDGLGDVGLLIEEQAEKIGVRGTFNAAPGSLLGLQTSGKTQERIAKAAEETAKNTERIERAINDYSIAFA